MLVDYDISQAAIPWGGAILADPRKSIGFQERIGSYGNLVLPLLG
jgi:hypothetical protein